MRFEHEPIGLESSDDVFRRVDTVNTHNGVLPQQRADLLRRSLAVSAPDRAKLLCDRDRNGIGSHLGTSTPPTDRSRFEVNHGPLEQRTCSLQEVPRIALGLEPDDVVAH